jgi:hypothetical protein
VLNNKNDYIGSGSMGYTRDLPGKDWQRGDKVRTSDLWVLLESQETVSVGPDHLEEFIFPFQQDIAKMLLQTCQQSLAFIEEFVKFVPGIRFSMV